jgi:predicted enzyme related to lactoylglutathione lyase
MVSDWSSRSIGDANCRCASNRFHPHDGEPPEQRVRSEFLRQRDSINTAIERVEAGGGWIIRGQDPQGAMFSLVSSQE